MANFLATQRRQVLAAAPFYGSAPALEDVSKIKADMLIVLAATDERVNASWLPYRDALEKAGVRYSLYQPPGTQHGFHNDTTPRYDAEAAREAWRRTLVLFERVLRDGDAG
jgi:carboxymethylenebutenolidase